VQDGVFLVARSEIQERVQSRQGEVYSLPYLFEVPVEPVRGFGTWEEPERGGELLVDELHELVEGVEPYRRCGGQKHG
jgi:hypothetical protein